MRRAQFSSPLYSTNVRALRTTEGVLSHKGTIIAASAIFESPMLHKYDDTMANWQDIRALEERIYDVVDEYLSNAEAYKNASLRVWLDEDDMLYRAEVDDNLPGTEDDGVYAIATVLRDGDDGKEPDIDRINDIANSWIFLD